MNIVVGYFLARRAALFAAVLASLNCSVQVPPEADDSEETLGGGAAGQSAEDMSPPIGTGGTVSYVPPSTGGTATGGAVGLGTGGLESTGGYGGSGEGGEGGLDEGDGGYGGSGEGGEGGEVSSTGGTTGTGGAACDGFFVPCATGGTTGTGGSFATGGTSSGTGGTTGVRPGFTPLASNPPECPTGAPENPFGSCLGLPIYVNCQWTNGTVTYTCVCDWYHWLCL